MIYRNGIAVLFLMAFLMACSSASTPGTTEEGTSPVADAAVTDATEPIAEDSGATAAPDCSERSVAALDSRGEHQGIFDAARNRILIYGGNAAAPEMCIPAYDLVDEMWAYNLDCNDWEAIASPSGANGPGVRSRQAMVLDRDANRILLYGGRNRVGFGSYENYNDVWAFDLENDIWTQIATIGTPPAAASTPVMAFDAERNRLVIFGGNTSTDGLNLVGSDQLHQLDLSSGQWSVINAAGTGPSPRLWHSAVEMNGELFVFGGTPSFNGPFLNDAFALELASNTWRSVNGGGFGNALPDPRFGGELYADAERNRVLLIGGHDGGNLGNRNDVWALAADTGVWTRLREGDTWNTPSNGFCDFPADFATAEQGSPERRYGFAHPQSDSHAFVLGGKTDCGNANDVWSLELSTSEWTLLRVATDGEACVRTGNTTCSTLCY